MEQVDLIDVQDAAVGLGEQAGLEVALAGADGPLDVEAAQHPVLRGADGEIDHGDPPTNGVENLTARAAGGALVAGLGVVGIAVVGAAAQHDDLGEEGGQGAHGRGLGRALAAAHQHAAEAGVHRVEQECQLHALLAHDGGEGEQRTLHGGFRSPENAIGGGAGCG